MAQFFNPSPGQPQAMYGDATIAPYQQPMQVIANPQQQLQQPQQLFPGQQFQPGQRPMPQFPNQGQPNLQYPNQNPNFIAQQQRQQQQLQQARQAQAQVHGFPQAGMHQPHLQQQQQPLQLQQQQSFPQMHLQNQFPGHNAERSPMAPPSSGPMPTAMNAGPGMPQGTPQRPQALQQLHTRNNSQAMQFNTPDGHNWSAPTPPSGSATKSFFPQPTPSPTKASSTPSVSGVGAVSAASASPTSQVTGLPQKAQPGQPPRPILSAPLSPEDAKRETQRVGALLDLNRILLQEIVQLQVLKRAGPLQKPGSDQGGQASPTVPDSANSDTKDGEGEPKDGEGAEKKKHITSREYIECMRRVQANLAYLAVIADRSHKPLDKIPERPAIMEPLPPIPGNSISEEALQSLKEAYENLRALFSPTAGSGSGSQTGTPTTKTGPVVGLSQQPNSTSATATPTTG